jgi:Nucleotidyl transferase AbiEii toxin, Type IV TA system
MELNNPYKQVQLLIRILPLISTERCFALKGGTAINLFVRDLPRLSVDIDLVYLPMDERATALANIRVALGRIAETVTNTFRGVTVQKSFRANPTGAFSVLITLTSCRPSNGSFSISKR